jgi:uracil phosphoribosyltransferase
MPLRLLDHPLAAHLVTRLRDSRTASAEFRHATHQLGLLLAIEATRDVPTEAKAVTTPLEATTGRALTDAPLAVIPILRAGLSLAEPFLELFPHALVGHLGLARNHATAIAQDYYVKLPPLVGARVYVTDPMLATGGSAAHALATVRAAGAREVHLLCVVAAPEGVARLGREHPDVTLWAAALDRELDARAYIRPGLGDFGDRLYGTEA